MKGHICLVTSSFPRWEGDPTAPFLLQLARDLMTRGWQVHVLAPHAAGLKRREKIGDVTVNRFRYAWPESRQSLCYRGGALFNLRRRPADWLKVPAFAICQWLALRRLMRFAPCHAVHAHWLLPQGLVAVAAGRGVPVVISVHGSDVFALRGWPWQWFKRLALRRAAAVTVNSSATEAAVRCIHPGGAAPHRIPMGVAVTRTVPLGTREAMRQLLWLESGPVLLFVGRLVAQKGAIDLVEALAMLSDEWPSASAIIVGDGPERETLEARAHALGIGSRVHLAGPVEPARIPDYLAAADVFVAPSRAVPEGAAEGQGLAAIEAMLAGVPVIASRSGGLVDSVHPDITGMLVDPGSPTQIAAAVARLLRNPDLAQRLAHEAQAMATTSYSAATTADAFSRLFDGLVASRLSPPFSHGVPKPRHDSA